MSKRLLIAALAILATGTAGDGSLTVETAPSATDDAETKLHPYFDVYPEKASPAPCLIFCDAAKTRAASREWSEVFHEYSFEWDFGDPDPEGGGDATWATTGTPKNKDRNPLAAHVYRSPGRYTITLTVTDPTGKSAHYKKKIVVQDPEVVLTKTHVFSNDSDFTGAPSGAMRHPNSKDWRDVTRHVGPGVRLLCRRGHEWRCDQNAGDVRKANGPWLIGAFGTGDDPVVSVQEDSQGIQGSEATRGVVQNIDFDGGGRPKTQGVDLGRLGADRLLFYRCRLRRMTRNTFNIGGPPRGRFQPHRGIGIVECVVRDGDYLIFWLRGERICLLGNDTHFIEEASRKAEHHLRMQWGRKVVIAHSVFTGMARGRHAITIRGPSWQGGTGSIPAGSYTEQVILYDNLIQGGEKPVTHAAPVSFESSADAGVTQRGRDLIMDSCHIRRVYNPNRKVYFEHSRFTVRNCIFDSSASRSPIALHIADQSKGSPDGGSGTGVPPSEIRIYNNTAYTTGSGHARFLIIGKGCRDVTARNNLLVCPNTRGTAIQDDSDQGSMLSHNLVLAQGKEQVFVEEQPFDRADFRIRSGASRDWIGTQVPVRHDIGGQERKAPPGVGAWKPPN